MTATPDKISFISRVVQTFIDERRLSFSIQGEALTSEEVASPSGLLPLLLEEASVNAVKVFGDGWAFRSHYRYDPDAVCQMIPQPPSVEDVPVSMLLPFLDHLIEERGKLALRNRGPGVDPGQEMLVVDDWLARFIQRYQEQKIQVDMPSSPAPGATQGVNG